MTVRWQAKDKVMYRERERYHTRISVILSSLSSTLIKPIRRKVAKVCFAIFPLKHNTCNPVIRFKVQVKS